MEYQVQLCNCKGQQKKANSIRIQERNKSGKPINTDRGVCVEKIDIRMIIKGYFDRKFV